MGQEMQGGETAANSDEAGNQDGFEGEVREQTDTENV